MWVGLAVLVFVAAVLAFISTYAVQAVLAPQKEGAAQAQAPVYSWQADTARVRQKNVLLVNAAAGERNPFAPPPAPVRPAARAGRETQAVQAAPEPRPAWTARLIDRIDSRIRISVNQTQSDWLHAGDTYQGWKIVKITENAVTVSKGERTEVLPWVAG